MYNTITSYLLAINALLTFYLTLSESIVDLKP